MEKKEYCWWDRAQSGEADREIERERERERERRRSNRKREGEKERRRAGERERESRGKGGLTGVNATGWHYAACLARPSMHIEHISMMIACLL